MNAKEMLERYKKGERDFYRAVLRGANLSRANLRDAVLRGADLRDADLSGAVLSRADLSRANLSRAVLSGADLRGANLSRASLNGTCLSPNLIELQREFVTACPAIDGVRRVYRMYQSPHMNAGLYEPGQTYTAPCLSFSSETECHPGIYVGSFDRVRQYASDSMCEDGRIVCGEIPDGDWTICAKGFARTLTFECLHFVDDEGNPIN